MTVSTTTARADYNGNGSTTAFTVPFYFLDSTHLTVIRTQISTNVPTTLALTTDYTVTGAGVPAGGTVTCLVAPTTDQKISILRNVPFTQLNTYVPNDPFPAASHEQALDKLTMLGQQINEAQGRALTLSPLYSGISTTLPAPSANALIGWNANANALQSVAPSTVLTIAASSSFQYQTFSGNGSQTIFTLSGNPGILANLEVYISGVRQTPVTVYSFSDTTLTFTQAPPSGTSNILVRWGQTFGIGTVGDGLIAPAKLSTGGPYWDTSGNVGVGNTLPGSKLDVSGGIRLRGSTSGYVGLSPAAAAGATTYTLPSADGSNGQTLTTNGSGTLSWSSSGVTASIVRNTQTGTSYTVLTGDRGKWITFNNAASVGVTLPQANGTTFGGGWYFYAENIGSGTVTITPTTSTINTGTALVLRQGEWALIESDDTNYRTLTTGRVTGASSVREVGTRGLPVNSQTGASYTLAFGDEGGIVQHSGATALTLTIPANASVAFPVGTAVTIVNEPSAANITVSITTDTLNRGDGTAGTGSRTIAASSVATLIKTTSTSWVITGKFT